MESNNTTSNKCIRAKCDTLPNRRCRLSILRLTISESTILNLFPPSKQGLTAFPLSQIDLIRETILASKGNAVLTLNQDSKATGLDVINKIVSARFSNLGGLLLKTYDSDIFQNWVKTDWIDGENGISAITAVAVQDGTITIDSLNLQQKVYNMLNRIAVSGGTYRDWLETVYTTGNYMERT